MWLNKQHQDYAIRKGGSPDGYVNYLKVWQIFVTQ